MLSEPRPKMKNNIKKIFGLLVIAPYLSGCGISTFTQRETDPFILDVFTNLVNPVEITVTDSSRRLVYQFKKSPNGIDANGKQSSIYCSDSSPDTAIAASGAIGGDVSVTIPNSGNGSLGGYRSTTTSTMPLIRRSQGLQYARDNLSLECMLFAMGVIDGARYVERIKEIRDKEAEIILKEVEKGLGDLKLGETNPSPDIPAKP
jgi:hypothetical protein